MDIRERFFSNSEKMRGLSRSLLSCIYLNHTGNIKRIHPSEWIRGNQDDSTVCVYLLLRIA